MVRVCSRRSPSRPVAGILRSRTWLSCRMSPPKSASNCAMNMCWATAPKIQRATENTGGCWSGWRKPPACRPSGRCFGRDTLLLRSRILSALALAAGLLVVAGAILAQNAQNPGASPDEIPVFTADTRLVVVHASVLDRNGKMITNLSESAFKVQENGVDQTIKIFRREDIPVSMGILIDNSGSMRNKSAKVAAAALDLARASNRQAAGV